MKLATRRWAAAVTMLGALFIATTAIAGLLGVIPTFPNMGFEGGATTAQISNGSMTVSASPSLMLITNVGPLTLVASPSSLNIAVTVDPTTCDLVGGVATDDLLITGTVDVDPLGVGDVRTGTLLSGEILAMGIGDSTGTVDTFDFRFEVTGGSLADFYSNEDAGVTLNVENFLFAGDCTGTFQGKPKGNVGPIPPVQPAEGCTPGYWKQKHHFDSWEATPYDPNDTVASAFGPLSPAFDNILLKDALALKGGDLYALMRHAVAALLNASNPDVNSNAFPTAADVIAATQAAFAGGDVEATKNSFEEANETGCPLN